MLADIDNMYAGNDKSVANIGRYIGQALDQTLKNV